MSLLFYEKKKNKIDKKYAVKNLRYMITDLLVSGKFNSSRRFTLAYLILL